MCIVYSEVMMTTQWWWCECDTINVRNDGAKVVRWCFFIRNCTSFTFTSLFIYFPPIFYTLRFCLAYFDYCFFTKNTSIYSILGSIQFNVMLSRVKFTIHFQYMECPFRWRLGFFLLHHFRDAFVKYLAICSCSNWIWKKKKLYLNMVCASELYRKYKYTSTAASSDRNRSERSFVLWQKFNL